MQATLSYHTQPEHGMEKDTAMQDSSVQGQLEFKISENGEHYFLQNIGTEAHFRNDTILVEEGRIGDMETFPPSGHILSASVDVDPATEARKIYQQRLNIMVQQKLHKINGKHGIQNSKMPFTGGSVKVTAIDESLLKLTERHKLRPSVGVNLIEARRQLEGSGTHSFANELQNTQTLDMFMTKGSKEATTAGRSPEQRPTQFGSIFKIKRQS